MREKKSGNIGSENWGGNRPGAGRPARETYTWSIWGETREGRACHRALIASASMNAAVGYWRKTYHVSPEVLVRVHQTEIPPTQAEMWLTNS